jgi:hypothetical protein
MAIIYTFPIKTNPVGEDLILISDSADNKKTKQVKVSSLPSSGGGSVTSVGLSLSNLAAFAITGDNPVTGSGTITLGTTGGSAGQYLDYQGNWSTPAGGGSTYSLQAQTKSGSSVPLKLNASTGSDSTVNLTEGANVTLTRTSETEITIASTGGAAGVSSFTNANGTYISAGTVNTAAVNAVTMGTIDLSAVDGTSDTTTRFLSKDNTWDVPSYTAAYSLPLANSSTRGGVKIVSTRDVSPLPSPSTTANRDYQVQMNTNASYSEQLFVNVPWTDTAPVDSVSAGTSGASTGSALTVSPTTGAVKVTSNSYAGTTNVGHVPTGGSATTFLRGDGTWQTVSATPSSPANSVQFNNSGAFGGSANLTFATNTLTLTDTLDIKGDGTNPGTLNLYCENTGTPHAVSILGPQHSGATPYSIRLPKEIATQTAYSSGGRVLESNASGALQWIATPTSGSGSSASLGFTPCSIYAATSESVINYTYYMAAVCDVDITIAKCKVAVIGATGSIYMAIYSMTTGSLQNSTLARLGTFTKTSGVTAGINELDVDGTITLTAGQNICIGVSSACKLAAATPISDNNLGIMLNSATTTFPATPDFEGSATGTKKPAIHFYAS